MNAQSQLGPSEIEPVDASQLHQSMQNPSIQISASQIRSISHAEGTFPENHHHSLKAVVQVKNRMGLHARPATHLVQTLYPIKSQISFSYKQNTVDGKSILGLLMLGAPRNAKIAVEVIGPDAETALSLIQDAFDQGLGDSSL